MSAAPSEALHRGRARIIASQIHHATPFSQTSQLSSLTTVFIEYIFTSYTQLPAICLLLGPVDNYVRLKIVAAK